MAAKSYSFQMIDYRIRPNKHTERRMLSDVFRRLSFFEPIRNYQYVGFGSTTFTDFILLHRDLDIRSMISIENKVELANRFKFNKPFDCVDVKFGEASDVLPTLDWSKRTIVWLDYDGSLDEDVLQDIALVSSKAVSGSMLLVTVNAGGIKLNEPNLTPAEADAKLMEEFTRRINRKPPLWLTGNDLVGNAMAATYYRIISDNIADAIWNRSGLPETRVQYRSLLNIVYKDGAKMLTVGGVFYNDNELESLERCDFDALDFVVKEDLSPFEINVPMMTPRERHFLNQRLPNGASADATELGLTQEEISNYIRLYRYCPSFVDADLS